MDTSQMEAFLAVCEYDGFTNAARRSHTSQSTLSRKIAALEEELGAALFLRTAQGLELTEAGLLFEKECTDLLQRINSMKTQIALLGSGLQGSIDVGMPMNLFGKNAALGIYSSEMELPGVETRYTLLDFAALNKGLLNRMLDVVITCDFAITPLPEEMESVHLFDEPFVFFVHKGHELCAKEHVTIDDLTHNDLAVIDTTINPFFLNHVLHQFRMANAAKLYAMKNHESMILKAATSNAIGVCPQTLYESWKDVSALEAIKIPEIDTNVKFYLVWRKDNEDPHIRIFNKHIRKYLENR